MKMIRQPLAFPPLVLGAQLRGCCSDRMRNHHLARIRPLNRPKIRDLRLGPDELGLLVLGCVGRCVVEIRCVL